MRVETPLLVVGTGPAALVVAKLAAGAGLPCLLAGHQVGGDGDDVPVALTPAAVGVLERHRVLDVLRPYLAPTDPPTISPVAFEEVVKHHCVADLNVTVYDGVQVIERAAEGGALPAVLTVLTDGRSRWDLVADQFVDAAGLPVDLSDAIVAGAAGDAVAAAAR